MVWLKTENLALIGRQPEFYLFLLVFFLCALFFFYLFLLVLSTRHKHSSVGMSPYVLRMKGSLIVYDQVHVLFSLSCLFYLCLFFFTVVY